MEGRNTEIPVGLSEIPVKNRESSTVAARYFVIGAALLLLAWWPSRDILLRKQLTSGPEHLADAAALFNNAQSDPSGVRLYVGVISRAANTERRMAIRQTWGADAGLERVVFVVANPSNNGTLLRSLRQEAQMFKDLIVVGHVMESYYNITHQTLEMFRSAYAYSGRVTHVMKCDDDSYLHVGRLLDLLSQHPFYSTFVGRMRPSYSPQRKKSSRLYVSKKEWREDKARVTWAHGGSGYILTRDLADDVATTAAYMCPSRSLFKLEDVALASWLQCLQQNLGVQISAVHDSRFNAKGCADDNIVSHRMNATQMTCMYASDGKCCRS